MCLCDAVIKKSTLRGIVSGVAEVKTSLAVLGAQQWRRPRNDDVPAFIRLDNIHRYIPGGAPWAIYFYSSLQAIGFCRSKRKGDDHYYITINRSWYYLLLEKRSLVIENPAYIFCRDARSMFNGYGRRYHHEYPPPPPHSVPSPCMLTPTILSIARTTTTVVAPSEQQTQRLNLYHTIWLFVGLLFLVSEIKSKPERSIYIFIYI